MIKCSRAATILFSVCLLMIGGCFSYHSTKETTQPLAAPTPMQPHDSTTNTTTQYYDGGTHEHSTTTTSPY
jgi:hypothetical protein